MIERHQLRAPGDLVERNRGNLRPLEANHLIVASFRQHLRGVRSEARSQYTIVWRRNAAALQVAKRHGARVHAEATADLLGHTGADSPIRFALAFLRQVLVFFFLSFFFLLLAVILARLL